MIISRVSACIYGRVELYTRLEKLCGIKLSLLFYSAKMKRKSLVLLKTIFNIYFSFYINNYRFY